MILGKDNRVGKTMLDTMIAVMGGTETEESTKRRPRRVSTTLASLVLGLLVYAAGAVMYALGYHQLFTGDWNLLENRNTWTNIYEWSSWVKDAGIILVILGLVFYVAGRRKGV